MYIRDWKTTSNKYFKKNFQMMKRSDLKTNIKNYFLKQYIMIKKIKVKEIKCKYFLFSFFSCILLDFLLPSYPCFSLSGLPFSFSVFLHQQLASILKTYSPLREHQQQTFVPFSGFWPLGRWGVWV